MTVTTFRHKEVTVVTVASDSQSMLPPLCQILKSLCYSAKCCSEIKGLLQTKVVSALGVRESDIYASTCSIKWWFEEVKLFKCETMRFNSF